MINRVLALAATVWCLTVLGCANNNVVVVRPLPPQGRGSVAQMPVRVAPKESPTGQLCTQIPPLQVAHQSGYRQLSIALDGTGSTTASKLTAADMRIFEGGNRVEMAYFHQEPVTLGIMVDSSASMRVAMGEIKSYLTELVNQLNSDDQIFVIAFEGAPFLLQPFTTDHAMVNYVITELRAAGETAMHTTVVDGLGMARRGCYRAKSMLLVSDGFDSASQISEEQMMSVVESSGIPINTVGVAEVYRPLGSYTAAQQPDMKTLTDIAAKSGGEAYVLPMTNEASVPSQSDASDMADWIDNHYVVGFVADKAANSKIRIELLNHPGSTLRIESGAGSRD